MVPKEEKMDCSLGFRRGRAVLVRFPAGRGDTAGFFWYIGKLLSVRENGIRVAIVDPDTLMAVRVVEVSRCAIPEFCSLNIDIEL